MEQHYKKLTRISHFVTRPYQGMIYIRSLKCQVRGTRQRSARCRSEEKGVFGKERREVEADTVRIKITILKEVKP